MVYIHGILVLTEGKQTHMQTPRKHKTLTQCWFMLGQCRRRWANVKPPLVQRSMFIGMLGMHCQSSG